MGQRHKHADVIIAWAEGTEVEYRKDPDRPWIPLLSRTNWYTFEDVEYRIKPLAKRYRVALFHANGNTYTNTADNQEAVECWEASPAFVRWLTDWIEYEE